MKITPDNISELTPQVIAMLDSWGLSSAQMLTVLGLSDTVKPRDLRKFRARAKPLPFSSELAERVEHIAGIIDALRTSFPFSAEFRSMWLYQKHRRFNQRQPLAVILSEGLPGLIKVRVEVDCAYGWRCLEGPNTAATSS